MQANGVSTSGLIASQAWLDRISNNLANLNTTGFAAQTQTFSDAYTQALSATATGGTAAGRVTPPGWWGGSGVLATTSSNDFSVMPLQSTGVSTDLALQGDAFFLIHQPNGSTALTKDGHFHWSPLAAASGQAVSSALQRSQLVTSTGAPVLDINGQPIVATTEQAGKMSVAGNGQITWGTTGAGGAVLGPRIAMASVPSPDNTLVASGDNLYTTKPGFAPVVVNGSNAGAGGLSGGSIVQGSLLGSNVDVTTQMTQMIDAQKMFELNAEAYQLTNQMRQAAAAMKL